MKKITKIGTIALILAVAFTGCANPNGGNAGPNVESVTVNDIVKPNSYTPSTTSKAVTTEEEAAVVFQTLGGEIENLMSAPAMDMGKTFSEDKNNKEALQKMAGYNLILKNKQATGESYDESCTVDFVPGYYEKEFGSYKNLSFSTTYGEKFDKDSKTKTNIINSNAIYTIDIKDLNQMVTCLKKLNDTVQEFKVMKAAKYSTKSISNVTVTQVENKTTSVVKGENTMNGAVLFDNGNYNGIAVFDLQVIANSSTPVIEVNATFYDINGKNPKGPFKFKK